MAAHITSEPVCRLVTKHNATDVLRTIVACLPHPTLIVPHLAERPRAVHHALVAAVKGTRLETVKELLKHTAPRNNRSEALQWASAMNCREIFDWLAPRSDAVAAMEAMQNSWFSKEHGQLVAEYVAMQAQKATLTHAFGQRGRDNVARKL